MLKSRENNFRRIESLLVTTFRQMKYLTIIILVLFNANNCMGQNFVRQNAESNDNLISRTIESNSVKIGQSYELRDSTSATLIYFEIKALDSAKLVVDSFENQFGQFLNPYSGRATVTLFNVLYSVDNIHFQKHTVDTINYNSGCCPCHQPNIVDSIAFIDNITKNDLILYLIHPVSFNCNSISHYYALFYKNFWTNIKQGIFSFKPFASFPRNQRFSDKESEIEMIKYFYEMKNKK